MKIKIQFRDSNLITGSNDRLRQTLGGYYEIANSSLDTTGLQRTLQYVSPDSRPDSPFYTFEHVLDTPQTSMISAVIANTDLTTTASSTSLFPYYTVPMSIVGTGPAATPGDPHELSEDAELLTSDEKWKKYILGGVYNEVEYPGVYFGGTYDINNFNLEAPYDLLYVKAIDAENEGSYETIEKKSVYNMYLPAYQEYNDRADEQSMLNIYDLVYCVNHSQYTAFATVKEQMTLGGLYNHDMDSVFDPVLLEAPALTKTEFEAVATAGARAYSDDFEKIREYYYTLANSSSLGDISGKNLMFNKDAISDMWDFVHYGTDDGEYFPFYNKIGLPTFDGGPLNSLIVQQGFGNLLLSTIKDAFVADTYRISETGFVAAQKANSLNSEGSLQEEHTVTNVSYRYVDFKEVLSNLNNNPTPAMTSPCRFMGKDIYEKRAATDSTGVMNHINKVSATRMLDAVQKGLLSTEPVGKLPADVTPENYMPWSDIDTFDVNGFLSLSDGDLNQRAECIAIRINKRNTASDNETNFIIQNQPTIANSNGSFLADDVNREAWCYYDTQVKYGTTYQYTTYGYFMVVGYRYKYSDLAISRRISEYGQYSDADIGSADTDEFNDYTCIEFYNPTTGDTIPSPMKTSENTLLSPIRINLLSETFETGYASAAQELAGGSHISFADFKLHIEPTVKIYEVPLGTKALTVLDNPPPKVDVQPYQVKDQSQAIGFFIRLENPPVKNTLKRTETYPTPITEDENAMYAQYLLSQNMLSTDKLKFGTVSRPSTVEIYRLNTKPDSMSEFKENLVSTKSLVLSTENNEKNRTYISTTCFYEERIATGHKFYYAFRFLNENNVPGPWSHVVEAEMIDDGGYKYTNFNSIMENELGNSNQIQNPSTQFKKLLMMRPALPQIDFNTEELDYSQLSADEYTKAQLAGTLTERLWNKKYKIRLTSKKTGKKIDLNVNYKLIEGS